ncbi:hypothetical protein ACFQY4_20395 [Catellatospora bangladeshensis]|uniref:Uncharacterized protein n=1 Tax=Catellatospora bangladeshensis TaxID=310355 RepID=A0A8J3NJB6_9ACTN|nr:hypothetical protein [Catellatospora bangladeshensis]GIF82887.1 hypothetical protein Cba03nite_42360 [Catellatospora bangladeshensis]
MYQFEADAAGLGIVPQPSPADTAMPESQSLCDGCGQPSPCSAVTHAEQRDLAADFAKGYSGL